MDFAAADEYAKDQAERMAESQVLEALEENLPEDGDRDEWNWDALAKMARRQDEDPGGQTRYLAHAIVTLAEFHLA